MSLVNAARGPARSFFSIDISWYNIAFSLRTAIAAILALAIACWLELSDPQWATLTGLYPWPNRRSAPRWRKARGEPSGQ